MWGGEELLTLDYGKLTAVLSGESANGFRPGWTLWRRGRGQRQRPRQMAEEAALDLLRRLASDFNVRDARKLYQIAKREFPTSRPSR